jgi:hypothetical protein
MFRRDMRLGMEKGYNFGIRPSLRFERRREPAVAMGSPKL